MLVYPAIVVSYKVMEVIAVTQTLLECHPRLRRLQQLLQVTQRLHPSHCYVHVYVAAHAHLIYSVMIRTSSQVTEVTAVTAGYTEVTS